MAKITTTLFGQLALIPQVAEVPILEQLSFLTDQIVSWNGTEQNIQLREKPRQSFKFNIPFNPSTGPGMFNTSWGAIRQKWAVPVWTDAQYVGNVANGATSITCDVTNYDLRASSLAMLFDGCGGYRILEISTLGANLINCGAVVGAIKGAMLIPVRVGWVNADITNQHNGHNGKVSINFEVIDTAAYAPAAPDQYAGDDIYYTPGLLDGDSTDTNINKRDDEIDFDLGPVEHRSPWLRSKFGRTYRQIMGTPAERKTYRDFIYRRAGKARNFWMPTFTHDLRITNTGTIVSTLVFPKDSYIDYATARTHVAIESTAGVWYPRVLSAPTSTGTETMQATLSSALNIPASTVKRVCYLGLNRLDTDLIEFNYSSPKLVESAVRILELTP